MQLIHLAFLPLAAAAPSQPQPTEQTAITSSGNTSINPLDHEPFKSTICSIVSQNFDETGKITPEGIERLNEVLREAPPMPVVEAVPYVEVEGVGYFVPEEVFDTEEFERGVDDLEDGSVGGEEFVRRFGLEGFRDDGEDSR